MYPVARNRDQQNQRQQSAPFEKAHDHHQTFNACAPRTPFNDSRDPGPPRTRTGGFGDKQSRVEPPRTGNVPPSTIISNCPSSWARTSAAVTAAGIPLRFALVAVTGFPSAFASRVAKRAFG